MPYFYRFIFSVILASCQAPAQPVTATQTQSTIDKAKKLILLRDREGATRLLVREIERATDIVEKDRLLRELNKTSEIFFTNEGQKLYELAESLRFDAKEGYFERYDSALALEKNNTKILKSKSLALIALGRCQ